MTQSITAIDAKLPLCKGCRDDYYNQCGKRCWSLDSAHIVIRYRIGWWTQPTQPDAYQKVVTLDCHRATGTYAQHTDMPACFPGKSRVEASKPFDARAAQ